MTENVTATQADTTATTESKSQQAKSIVSKYVKGTGAIGLLPMPLVDAVAVTTAQLKMIHSISQVYEVEFNQNKVKSILASLLGGIVPLSLKTNLFSLCKGIPVLGQTVGILGMSLMSAASTYAVGQVFIQHFGLWRHLIGFRARKNA